MLKQKYSLGIDITDHGFYAVLMQHTWRRHQIVDHFFQAGNKNKQSLHQESFADFMFTLRDNTPKAKVILGLPLHKIQIQELKLDRKLKRRDINQYLTINAKKLFQYERNDLWLSYYPFFHDKQWQTIKTIAVTKLFAQPYLNAAQQAGLKIHCVDLNINALTRVHHDAIFILHSDQHIMLATSQSKKRLDFQLQKLSNDASDNTKHILQQINQGHLKNKPILYCHQDNTDALDFGTEKNRVIATCDLPFHLENISPIFMPAVGLAQWRRR